ARGCCRARRARLSDFRSAPDAGGQAPGGMDGGSRPVLSGNQRTGNFCGRRRAPSLGERRDVRGRGGRHGRETGSPISRTIMSLTSTELQQVRSTPLFAELEDAKLACIESGEIIDAPLGTILAGDGEQAGY